MPKAGNKNASDEGEKAAKGTDMKKAYETHPFAEMFPLMPQPELKELAKDIKKAKGLTDPIVLYEGKVLDGRNRLIACEMARVKPRFVQFEREFPNGDPLEFVRSRNLFRRHLTPSQKAAAAQAYFEVEKQRAKFRMSEGGKAHGKGSQIEGVERIPPLDKGKARDKLAKEFDVNPRYISDAQRLQAGSPELFEEVKAGKLSIPDAIKRLDGKSQKADNKPNPSKTGRGRERIGGKMPRTGMLAEVSVAIGCYDMDRRQEIIDEITATVRQAAGYDEWNWIITITEMYEEGDIIVHPGYEFPSRPKKWTPLGKHTRVKNCRVVPIVVTHIDFAPQTVQHEVWEKDISYALEETLCPSPEAKEDEAGSDLPDFDKLAKLK